MATKVQQSQRWNGVRDRVTQRRGTTVETPRFYGVSRLPSNPVAWYPESSAALGFAEKLLGTAPFLEGMLRTEAGNQYKKARARAMRGEFTLDDSGLFTFKKEQQRAISEVEGALSGVDAVNTLSSQALELEKELSSSDLTPAQKVAAYTTKMRELAYRTFEGNTADTDYVLAKGTEIHRFLEGITSGYRERTIRNQLAQEQNQVVTLFRSRVNQLGSGLSGEEKAAELQTAMAEFSRNMKRVTGVDASLTPEVLKQLTRELVSTGNREVLEKLRGTAVGETGATMESLGLITDTVLEEADRAYLSVLRRREQEKALKSVAAVEKYTRSFGSFDTSLLDLGKLSGEDRMTKARELSNSFSEMIRQVNSDTELSEDARQNLRNMLSRFQMMASNGGMTRPLAVEEMAALRSMLDRNDVSGMTRFFRENPNVEPGVFKAYRDMAFSVSRTAQAELLERKEWSDYVVLSSDLGADDPMVSARERQESARQELYRYYLEEKNQNKEGGETAWREGAEKRFRQKYHQLTRDEASSRETMANFQRKLREPVADFAELSDLPVIASKAGEADYQQLKENLLNNPSLSDEAKGRLRGILPASVTEAKNLPELWGQTLKGSDWKKMEGSARVSGKFYDDFTPVDACFAVVRQPDGKLLAKPVNALSAEDQQNLVTSPISSGMRYLRNDGSIGRITEIESEEELVSVLSNENAMKYRGKLPDWSSYDSLTEYRDMHVLVDGWFGPSLQKIGTFLTPSVWRPPAELFQPGYTPKPSVPELLSPVPVEMMTVQELNAALGWE